MTTPYAFGAVTAVLRSRLTATLAASGVSASVGGVKVTALPPDRIVTGKQEENTINIFLHHVSRNPGWANVGPPPRNGAGDLVAPTPMGVDLHYVVSAYGQDPLATDILLGHATAAFADEPVLTRAAIRRALAPTPPDPTIPPEVASSRLADQIESLKLCPANPGTEEVARLWASFMAPYRPSAFYDVSVVLIEPAQPSRAAFPVAVVAAAAIDLARPEVDTVTALGPPGTPLTAQATLVIAGRSLAGDGLAVRVGASVATPAVATERELQVAVSAFVPSLRAGLQGLVVTHDVQIGAPPTAHAAAASDAFPLALRPTVSFGANAVAVTATTVLGGVTLATGTVTATVDPAVGRDQQVLLSLAEAGAPVDRSPRGATLAAPAENGAAAGVTGTTSIAFPFTRVPQGTYVARLLVDGVESAVQRGASGRYDAPAVTL